MAQKLHVLGNSTGGTKNYLGRIQSAAAKGEDVELEGLVTNGIKYTEANIGDLNTNHPATGEAEGTKAAVGTVLYTVAIVAEVKVWDVFVDLAGAYVPANVANWSGVAPTSVMDALDRISAALGPIA